MLFNKNTTFLLTGDSITDSGRLKDPYGIGIGYVNVINAMITCAYPDLGIKIINTGISGNTIHNLRERWQADVLDHAPDYLSIMIGVNDVWRYHDHRPEKRQYHVPLPEYKATYKELLEQTIGKVDTTILITPYLAEPNKSDPFRIMLDEYVAAVKQLSADFGTLLVDTQSIIDNYMYNSGISPINIAIDRVHPTGTGCMMIAKGVLSAVGFNFAKL